MSSPILSVDNVSKDYRLWHAPSDRLIAPMLESMASIPMMPAAWREGMRRSAEKRARRFHALHPVSFDLNRGESLGIIGRNGAGKSTLLQIIAGTLSPSTGKVACSGRVAALLELGSGFNLDFTGRENVLLTASLQGMTTREAEDALAEVVSFASIGDFLDQPVKTYSSGMMVRLAFAAQTILGPPQTPAIPQIAAPLRGRTCAAVSPRQSPSPDLPRATGNWPGPGQSRPDLTPGRDSRWAH